ncbi:MAG: RNA polymerase sigma factor [Acidimicrobiales bacterium]
MRPIGLPTEQLNDEALLAGFGAGDEELAVAFVRRFQTRVFGVALAIVGQRKTAEDVAQLAFERAWRHAGAFDPLRGSVQTWLTTIVRNLAIDTVRVRVPQPVDTAALVDRVVGRTPERHGPEHLAMAAESAGQLRAALRLLPAEQARAVVLASIAGMSASQVAASEGIPLGTAKTRIRAAMGRLRAELAEAGGRSWTT